MTTPPLILASTSPYRRAQLEQLGVPFSCEAPGVDERAAEPQGATPREVAAALARAKALAVAARHPGAIVIGGDQVCVLDDEVLHKPGSAERAVEQHARLAGRTHRLISAICVARGERCVCHEDVTELDMRPLSEEERRRYVEADQPLDCAGSYKLEARGVTLFSAIRSADHSAIQGLPLLALCELLRAEGVALP
ncbi:MAG TPA: septum formation protein Maf [Planctomycetes bacterium]|nr:septum formation protein Maf [Planctomycetota bacterium]